MKVLGVSGSPIENSNTDRIVKTIFEASGLDTEFINLQISFSLLAWPVLAVEKQTSVK